MHSIKKLIALVFLYKIPAPFSENTIKNQRRLRNMGHNTNLIAVDIGASYIRVALGNMNGIRQKIIEETDARNDSSAIPLQIIRMIRELNAYPDAIGIGSIGPIDIRKGIITNTPNYKLQNIPIVHPLKTEYEKVVKMVNDCTAAVLGEKMFGAGRESENIFYVTLSTGLGGGAIVDGKLLRGKDGNAVEVGHFTIDHNSRIICGCGSPGHWEAFCGGKNIPNFAVKRLMKINWRRSILNDLTCGNLNNLTTKMIFNAAKQGDDIALQLVEDIGRINAVGFANIVNAYDPEIITVGGSIALNNPGLILTPIKHFLPDYVINRIPKIMITPLRDDVVLYGGLALALCKTGI
jgi:glucokinase